MRAPLRSVTTVRVPWTPWLICMPLRLMERICPLGRTLAVPPPFSETVRPGGVWLPTLVREAAAGRAPAALVRPAAVVPRPAGVLVRPVAVERPAVVPVRPVVAGRPVVVVWPAPVVPGRFVVGVRFVVAGRPVVACEGAVLCDGVECEGAALCDGAECDGAEWDCAGCDGALACGAGALGADPPPPPLGLCWPNASAGTTRQSKRTVHFCKIFSFFQVRFIRISRAKLLTAALSLTTR